MSRRGQARARRRSSRGALPWLAAVLALGLTALLVAHPAQPVSAQAPGALVSNIGQRNDVGIDAQTPVAQGFSTGAHGGGYIIHTIAFRNEGAGKAFGVSLWEVDSHGTPTTRVTSDFVTASDFSVGEVVFAAPVNTFLNASTDYAVVMRPTGSDLEVRGTSSHAEDSGAASGWSIANGRLLAISASATTWSSLSHSVRMAIRGQAVDTLVSNTGQTPTETLNLGSHSSQSFVSGGSYTITSIEVVSADAEGDSFDVSIWNVDSNRLPRTKLRDLGPPDSFAAGTLKFTVPRGGLRTVRQGVYAVVFEPTGALGLSATSSDSEDSGAKSNWSIDDTRGLRSVGGTWSTSPGGKSFLIRVNGYSGHAPGAPGDPRAGDINGGRVHIQWTAGNAGTQTISGYRIEVSTDAGANWSHVATAGSSATSYTDTRAGPYENVRYRVSAFSALGTGPPSDAVSVDPNGISLVRNFDQTPTESQGAFGMISQSFVSGGSYTITSIEVDATGSASFDVSIWNVDSSRLPRSKVRDLDPPDSFAAGTLEFTVPGGGLQTVNQGVYAVVVDTKSTTVNLNTTTSDGEDSGAQSGWSIDDSLGFLVRGTNTWQFDSDSDSLMIGVKGYSGHVPGVVARVEAGDIMGGRVGLQWLPGTAGSEAISGYRIEVSSDAGATWTNLVADTGSTDTRYTDTRAGPYDDVRYRVSAISSVGTGPRSDAVSVDPLGLRLISNTGQTGSFTAETGAATGLSQAFSTSSGRFTLRAVEVVTTAANQGFTASLWTTNSNGSPKQKLVDFTIPGGFSDSTVVLVPPEHTEIGGSATYAIVLRPADASTDASISGTNTGDHDAGGQSGWSIADDHWHETSGAWTNQSAGPLRIAIKGSSGVAPGQPTALIALATGRSGIDLSWTAPADSGTTAISGYRIEVSTDGDTWTDLVANTGSTHTTYAHMDIPAGALRHYRVSAINSSGTGPPSEDASDRTNVLTTNALGGTKSTYSAGGIATGQGFLTGGDTGVVGYLLDSVDIFYTDDEGDTFTAALWKGDNSTGFPTGTAAVATLVSPGSFTEGRLSLSAPANTRLEVGTFYVVVLTYQGTGTNNSLDLVSTTSESRGEFAWFVNNSSAGRETASSPWTSRSDALRMVVRGEPITGNPPGKPTGLTATAVGQDGIALSWTAPADTGTTAISRYTVEAWVEGGEITVYDRVNTFFTVTDLTPNTTYRFRVSAVNSIGTGAASDTVTETTDVLVGNAFQTSSIGVQMSTASYGQSFTVGSHSGGSVLTAIEVLSNDPEGDDFTAALYATNASGLPTGSPTALTAPSGAGAFAAGRIRFTAPAGTTLESGKTYIVVLSRNGAGDVALATLTSDAEDVGKASGFSIGNAYATNGGGVWGTSTSGQSLKIAVRGRLNNAPVFADATVTRSIAENTAAGTDIGAAVAATDADTSDTLTYTLGGMDAASFAIDSTDGQLSTKTGVTYDFESKQTYTVTVTATDGTASAMATVTITITDEDEPPSAPGTPTVSAVSGDATRLSVTWTAPANTGKPDISGYDVRYRQTGTTSWSNGPQDVSGITATITGLTATTAYQVQVRASNDEGDSAWSASGSGTTNSATNNAPVFADTTVNRSIAENTAAGTDVGAAVSATDADTSDTLTYTLGGTDAASFAIDSTDGQLSTKTGVTYDFEAKQTYTVTVTATDGTASATATVTITITDEDEPPSAPGTPTVSAVSGDATRLSVTWTAPSNTGKPDISGYDVRYRAGTSGNWSNGPQDVSGISATITGLNASTSYQVQVRATNDEGDSAWSASGSGTTNSATNNAPVFADATVTRSIAENTVAGTDIGAAVSATDADAGDTLTYTLGGTDAASFAIDSTDGQLSTKTGVTYDFEAKQTYTVTVTASDATDSATATVTITITDEDEPPSAPGRPTVSAVSGSTTRLSVTWTAPANSGKPGISGYDLRYRQTGTTSWSNGPQNVTSTSTTIGTLSASTSYQVQVRASNDEGDSSWSSSGSGTTNSTTNNAPVFADATVTRSVAENTPAGRNVGAPVSATDADNDTLTYTLGGADAASFTIVSTTGQIQTRTGVTYDYESRSSYTVIVTATDGTASASATVTINVTDVDELPSRPAAPAVRAAPGSVTSLSVTWTAPSNTGKPAISGYDLRYRRGSSGDWTDGPWYVGGTSATISGLSPGTTYQVQVRAMNHAGDSAWSSSGSGTTGRPPVARVGGRVSGSISSVTDEDWFAVDLTAGGHYFLRLRYKGERMDQNGPLQIGGIRDQNGSEIDWRSLDFSCCYQSSGAFGANRTGRFYIPVGVPEWMAPSVSFPLAYTLEVHADEINEYFSPRPPASLAKDPSLAARGAGRAEVGAWTSGAFHDHDGSDRYTVQLCEGQSYRIPLVYNLTAGLDGKVRRPFIGMVRPDGSYEPYSEYRDPFTYTATETGPHYVELFRDNSQVQDANGNPLEPGDMGAGPYRFNVQFVGDGHTGANRPATGSPGVAGAAQVGQTLTVDARGICDADGTTRARFAYQWIRTDGASDTNISGATRATYTIVAADQGKSIKVRVSFTDDRGNAEALTSAATAVPGLAQNAPGNRAAEGAPAISGVARVGETLSVSTAGISDADGLERATFSYQWLLNGSELSGATGRTYTVVEGAVGSVLSVRVSFTDDGGNEESLTSERTATVVDSLLEVESATVDGATLKLNYPEYLNTLVDLPETAFTVTVNGAAVTVSDSSVSGKTVTLTLASAVAAGDTVTVGYAQPESDTQVIGDVRGRAAESFSGEEVTNETAPPPLTASARKAPASHDGSTVFTFELHFSEEPDVGYRTLRDHAFGETGGEVTKARRLTAGSNLGWEITVRPSGAGPVTLSLPVTADCGAQGAICTGGGKALAEALEVVVPGQGRTQGWLKPIRPPRNTPARGAPAISGTARVGETLRASTTGIADADGLRRVRFRYRWLADGEAIAGASGSSYTLVASDEGKAIAVRVSFSDDAGHAETLTSAATGAVAPPPLRASARGAPAAHDGSAAFTFELHFSEEPELSYVTLRDHALGVTGGVVVNARRLTPGSNLEWEITVRPSSTSAVTVVLPVTTDCSAEGAVCTGGGKKLSERLEFTVPGP